MNSAHSFSTATILIVDDQVGARATMKGLLANQGYHLEFAASGQEALEKVEAIIPDVILLDVMMPDMDGFEVCRQLRKNPTLAELPIIMLTALDDRESLSQGMEAGADDFMSKPVDRFLLRARLKNITRLNRFRSLYEARQKSEMTRQKAAQQQHIIAFLGQRALELSDLNLFFEEALSLLRSILQIDQLYLLQSAPSATSNNPNLQLIHSTSESEPPTHDFPGEITNVLGFALRQTDHVDIEDIHRPHSLRIPTYFLQQDIQQLTIKAIGRSKDRWGLLCLGERRTRVYTQEELQLLRSVISIFTSAVERHEVHKKLQYELSHDSVTGLPNREHFERILDGALAQNLRTLQLLGVALIRINNLHPLTHSLGQQTRRLIRKGVTHVIQQHLEEACEIASLSGDQFGILFSKLQKPEEVTQRMRPVIEALSQPIDIEGFPIHILITCGIALAPLHASERNELLRYADTANDQAIQLGETIAVFEPVEKTYAPHHFLLAAEIHQAIKNREFFLEFQPKVDLETSAPIGAEALVRWSHPKRGRMAPNLFIEVAEQTALIRPLTRLIIEEALQAMETWDVDQIEGFRLAINLSPSPLYDPHFIPTLEELLKQYDCRPEHLIFEVTETAVLSHFDLANRTLQALLEKGIHIAIDDFGTGYSSLNYLSKLHVNELKLDRSYVITLDNKRTYTIVKYIIQMSRELGLKVIAEGIEDQPLVDTLKEMGCRLGQGYFYSRPLPNDAFISYLAEHTPT